MALDTANDTSLIERVKCLALGIIFAIPLVNTVINSLTCCILRFCHPIYSDLEQWVQEEGITPAETTARKNTKVEIIECFEKKAASLSLVHKNLTSLPASLGSLTRLKNLYLSDNQLTKLPETLTNLTSLQHLSLDNNELTELPETLGNLTSLGYLYLDNNQLTKLPETLTNLTSLQELDLDNNQLTELPETFGNLTSLEGLSLNNNQLTKLPETFGSLTSLEGLSLNNNQLTKLPETFGNLTSLQELDLSNNELTELPETFDNLNNLQELDLSNNELTELPETFGSLTSLQEIYLSFNQLTKLPETLGKLTRLQNLFLENNQLTELPEILSNLTSLQSLSLDNNQLTELPRTLGKLIRLKDLSIENNQLRELPDSLVSLTNLQSLSLGSNQLTELPETLGSLTNLKYLDFTDNQLTEIPESFYTLPESTTIFLYDNLFPLSVLEQIQLRARFIVHFSVNLPNNTLFPNYSNCIEDLIGVSGRESFSQESLPSLDEEQEDIFLRFYNALSLSSAYDNKAEESGVKKHTANFLLDCLLLAQEEKDFSEDFFNLLQESHTSCGDRVAFYLNKIFVAYCCQTSQFNGLTPSDFYLGVARLHLLEKKANEFVANYQGAVDPLEVYLALPVKLHEELTLPVYVKHMIFFRFSSLDESTIANIKEEVLGTTRNKEETLLKNDEWELYIQKRFGQAYLEALEKIDSSPKEEEKDKDFTQRLALGKRGVLAHFTDQLLREEALLKQ